MKTLTLLVYYNIMQPKGYNACGYLNDINCLIHVIELGVIVSEGGSKNTIYRRV